MLKVAITGFGIAARCHVEAMGELPGYEVVAICTSRREQETARIRELCGPDIQIYDDYQDMLANSGADVISICTMHDVHADQIIMAANAGKHIALEKPLCLKPEDLLRVRAAVKAAGIKLCVCFQEFHFGQFLTALEVIEEGYLGDVHLAEVEYYNSLAPWVAQSWWARTKDKSGSSLLSGGCHGLMFMMLAMGEAEVDEVTAYATRSSSAHFNELEFPGTQINLIRFKDGRIGKVSAVSDSLQPYIFGYRLLGSEGTLIDRSLNSRKLKGLDPSMWTELGTRDLSDGATIGGYMFVGLFRAFYDHIVNDAPLPYTNFDSVFEMHRVLFAADRSAAIGKPVKLDGFLDPSA